MPITPMHCSTVVAPVSGVPNDFNWCIELAHLTELGLLLRCVLACRSVKERRYYSVLFTFSVPRVPSHRLGVYLSDVWFIRRGVAINLFWGYENFGGGIKLQYSCSIAILTSFLPHKKFTWTDFGVYIPIYPRRYAPVHTWCVSVSSLDAKVSK